MPDHPTDRAGRPHDGKSYIITAPSSPFTDADTAYLHGWIAGYQNGHRDGAVGLDHDVHRHVDPTHEAALARITGRDLPTLGKPLTEVELTRLGELLDGLSDEEWEALRPPVVERPAGLDRYVVLRHGDAWQVADLGPCSREQPARFMCTAVDDTTAKTITAALNESQTGDMAEQLDLAEATIAELDELVLALHNADDPADADAADEILAECRARQEAR